MKIAFADFETTKINEHGEVRVYLWAYVKGSFKKYGYDIESFINFVYKRNEVIFFHNLKFDFSYIQFFCLKNNIPIKILEKKGTIYNAKMGKAQFRDTLNLFPNMTLQDIGENYCSRYKKTSIDYDVDYNHKANLTEIEYCINDCLVLQEGYNNFIANMRNILEENRAFKAAEKADKKMTVAGIAFEAFKELSDFDILCPKTTLGEFNAFVKAYKGGYVFSKNLGILSNVKMLDCNSMYPYIYSTIPMPIGSPIKCKSLYEAQKYKFYIVDLMIKFELKDGYIPIIGGGIGKYGGTEYLSSSNGEWMNVTVCNYDFDLICEFYNCDYIVNWACGFESKTGMFKDYCDIFISEKKKSKGVRRLLAKVLLNSPYGKTAMNGLNEVKDYFIKEQFDENLNCFVQTVAGELIGYTLNEEIFQYIPIAIAITAGARHHLLKTAQHIGFWRVIYMDTDSIKFFGDIPDDLWIDPDELGAWKCEGQPVLFKTIAPKKYVYADKCFICSENGIEKGYTLHYTCAGISKKILGEKMMHNRSCCQNEGKFYINAFDSGLSLECLQSKKVTGGRALLPISKEIS